MEAALNTAGGKITCPRCRAISKRTGEQCGAPAERGKRERRALKLRELKHLFEIYLRNTP